jgi:hypothetical protein
LLSPGWGLAQDFSSCGGNAYHDATVIVPQNVAIVQSGPAVLVNPEWIAAVSSAAVCVGRAPWRKRTAFALSVVGRDTLGSSGGLRKGETIRYRIFDNLQQQIRAARASYASCDSMSRDLQPICRDDGQFHADAVYVLKSLRIDSGNVSPKSTAGLSPDRQSSLRTFLGKESVRLRWNPERFLPRRSFVVERNVSRDTSASHLSLETSWTKIGALQPTGPKPDNDVRGKDGIYSFVDDDLPYDAEQLMYRVAWADDKGRPAHSKPVTINRRSVNHVQLLAPFPNPARNHVTLRYATPDAMKMRLHIYDVLGRRVAVLADGHQQSGRHSRQIDVSGFSSGTYVFRLEAGGAVYTQRFTVVQ